MDEFSKKLYDSGINEEKFAAIKNVMLNFSCSIDKAMDALNIPIENRQFYKEHFAKEV